MIPKRRVPFQFRGNRPEVFSKVVVQKSFAKFTENTCDKALIFVCTTSFL